MYRHNNRYNNTICIHLYPGNKNCETIIPHPEVVVTRGSGQHDDDDARLYPPLTPLLH